MAYGLVGLYGLYLIFVGYKGNSAELMKALQTDGKGFIPWIVAIAVLALLYRSDTIRPVVKPFVFLALLTFAMKNWKTIGAQINAVAGQTIIKGA